MSDEDNGIPDADRAPRRRRVVAIVAAVVVVVALGGTIVAVTAQNSGRSASPNPSDEPGASESPTASPSLSSSQSVADPDPTDTPAPDPAFGEPVADEAPIGEVGVFTDGVTATVASVTPYEATGSGVGEVSGPAVRVKIDLVNGSAATLDLNQITVNAYYGSSNTPAPSYVSDTESVAFSGQIAPGGSASGTYSFAIGSDDGDSVTVTVSSRAGTPIVVFTP